MKAIRATINAVLVATLMKPLLRRSIRRWRQEVMDTTEATFIIPAHELLETALSTRGGAEESGPQLTTEMVDEMAGRSTFRTLLVVGMVAAIAAASAFGIAAVRRRRRAAAALEQREPKELVAVPVEAAGEDAEIESTAKVAAPAH
jgi:hypothetical protein